MTPTFKPAGYNSVSPYLDQRDSPPKRHSTPGWSGSRTRTSRGGRSQIQALARRAGAANAADATCPMLDG